MRASVWWLYHTNENVNINVRKDNSESQVLVRLKLKDTLSNVRKKLEEHSGIQMSNKLFFAKRNRVNGLLSTIVIGDEETRNLRSIIEKKSRTLHLKSENEATDAVTYLRVHTDQMKVSSKSSLSSLAETVNTNDDTTV